MSSPKELITTILSSVFERCGWDVALIDVVPSPDTRFGDYATPVALKLAKILEKSPQEVATLIIEDIKSNPKNEYIDSISFESGFINFRMSDLFYKEALQAILKEGPRNGVKATEGEEQEGRGKTVVLDYFQLNIAKQPHVGHLRSAVIGDALKRILLSRGYRVVADTHVGDWGTQFGILLYAYKKAVQGNEREIDAIKNDPFIKLQELYVIANQEEDIHEKGKMEFAKLEKGDSENRSIWKWMVEISMKKLEDNAARLKLLSFEEHRGESAYEEAMPLIVELALTRGVAKKTEDGAVVVDLTKEGLDEAVLVKSDGATTYLLRDLATIQYRKVHYDFWKNLYVVDNRQSHHFRQVFRVAELLGFEGVEASEHIEFGFMKLPEGAMSTRKGNVILLTAVLDEAERRARAVIYEKNPNLHNVDEVAKQIGLGAIKFFDLSHNRKSDIVFHWEDALSFEGKTGPYIQYTCARLKSILRKSADEIGDAFPEGVVLDAEERELLLHCARIPETIQRVIDAWLPHLLVDHLFELAQSANEFYHSHPILTEHDEGKRKTLLVIVRAVTTTLSRGLYLLGIDAPEEM
ncbi:MAG: arginine--tRNA ligase [Parcubacteria group bacterium]|nr:arginine--tRNA ligase [Parcubacteria group bacterium]